MTTNVLYHALTLLKHTSRWKVYAYMHSYFVKFSKKKKKEKVRKEQSRNWKSLHKKTLKWLNQMKIRVSFLKNMYIHAFRTAYKTGNINKENNSLMLYLVDHDTTWWNREKEINKSLGNEMSAFTVAATFLLVSWLVSSKGLTTKEDRIKVTVVGYHDKERTNTT